MISSVKPLGGGLTLPPSSSSTFMSLLQVSKNMTVYSHILSGVQKPPAPTPHSPALIADTPHKTDADCPPRNSVFLIPVTPTAFTLFLPALLFLPFFLLLFPPLLSIWACISYPVGTEVSLQSARPPFLSIHPLLPTPPPLYSLCLADFFFSLYSRNAEDILLWIGSGKTLPSNRISSRSKEGRKNRGAGRKRTRHCAT